LCIQIANDRLPPWRVISVVDHVLRKQFLEAHQLIGIMPLAQLGRLDIERLDFLGEQACDTEGHGACMMRLSLQSGGDPLDLVETISWELRLFLIAWWKGRWISEAC
jgi:hypothetical protein